MTRLPAAFFILTASLLAAAGTRPAFAGMWDDPQNIKALDEHITPDELRETMRGFATNTGSRCSHCHVYENERDLSSYDFAADDKERKQTARKMIRMVNDINRYLENQLGKPAAELVTVDCATCHRGQQKPERIQDVLLRAYEKGGFAAALAEYQGLRERYFGGYTFDFSEKALMALGEDLAGVDDFDGALQFLDLNLDHYPGSSQTLILKGQTLAASGDRDGALASYNKAIELEPRNQRWVEGLIQQLDAE